MNRKGLIAISGAAVVSLSVGLGIWLPYHQLVRGLTGQNVETTGTNFSTSSPFEITVQGTTTPGVYTTTTTENDGTNGTYTYTFEYTAILRKRCP